MFEDVLRFAAAIALQAFALILWNVGNRAPNVMARDIVRAFRDVRAFALGALALAIGLIAIAASVVLLLPVIVDRAAQFVPIETFAFVVALTIEFLIGNDIREMVAGGKVTT